MTSYSLIGPGRAGRSLMGALEHAARHWELHDVHGRGAEYGDVAADVDVVILAVPDDSIATVANAIEPGRAALLHLSGAKGLDVLAPHRTRASVHPLMSLPDPATGARRLREGIVFAVDGDDIALELVAALEGHPVRVPGERRALYHATAAVAANHLTALCAQVERLAEAVGVPASAYWRLMATSLDNIQATSAISSLTGPAARGDVQTVADHLDALPPSEHELYLTLATEAARLAGRQLPPEALTR